MTVVVDAILNSKLSMIRERHIAVDATALVPGELAVAGIDLSVLIRNLPDNAMEAALELTEEERFIRIYIDRYCEKTALYLRDQFHGGRQEAHRGEFSLREEVREALQTRLRAVADRQHCGEIPRLCKPSDGKRGVRHRGDAASCSRGGKRCGIKSGQHALRTALRCQWMPGFAGQPYINNRSDCVYGFLTIRFEDTSILDFSAAPECSFSGTNFLNGGFTNKQKREKGQGAEAVHLPGNS